MVKTWNSGEPSQEWPADQNYPKSAATTHPRGHKRPHNRACERSWAVRISAPRSRGCSLPHSPAQSHSRPLRSFPLPAHLQFHPAPVKSLHARSHLKFLCIPNTCRFQPKPWDTLSAWRTWSGFVAYSAQHKWVHPLWINIKYVFS